MDFLDYVQMTKPQRFAYKVKSFFTGIPRACMKGAAVVGDGIKKFFMMIANGFVGYGNRFVKGDVGVKASYVFMGAGNLTHGEVPKGILYFLLEVLYFVYFFGFGWDWLSKFSTLGTQEAYVIKDEWGFSTHVPGDDSMRILLFSVLTFIITIAFFAFYIQNTKSAFRAYEAKKAGKKPLSFVAELKDFLDEKFHITLLTLPIILLLVFTVLPIIFTIFIAFTNYDKLHYPPEKLFTWVGFENFQNVFYLNPQMSTTFGKILLWTIIWAIFSTFTCYIGGMVLAILINKKGIRFKAFFRTMFVISAAVPQFVTLMLMSQLLATNGVINKMLLANGFDMIPFLSDPFLAKVTVIIVNMWIGIPFTMLMISGLLMNIPADLYESARIDGANAFQQFTKITLPYMLFVTTPYLISTFVGNINNFNVIYLLTGGGPATVDYYQSGQTDLLVTWLYKLTVDQQDYKLGAVIGILVFVICAVGSLISFNLSKSSKNEEEFS